MTAADAKPAIDAKPLAVLAPSAQTECQPEP
jgi:hypothetical protein